MFYLLYRKYKKWQSHFRNYATMILIIIKGFKWNVYEKSCDILKKQDGGFCWFHVCFLQRLFPGSYEDISYGQPKGVDSHPNAL